MFANAYLLNGDEQIWFDLPYNGHFFPRWDVAAAAANIAELNFPPTLRVIGNKDCATARCLRRLQLFTRNRHQFPAEKIYIFEGGIDI